MRFRTNARTSVIHAERLPARSVPAWVLAALVLLGTLLVLPDLAQAQVATDGDSALVSNIDQTRNATYEVGRGAPANAAPPSRSPPATTLGVTPSPA